MDKTEKELWCKYYMSLEIGKSHIQIWGLN